MRFHPATGLAIAGAMVAALTVTACSSSSSTPTPAATSSSAPAASTAASSSPSGAGTGTSSGSGAVAQITTNWEAFFSSATPTAQRVSLLQNGSTFSSAISSFSSNPLASSVSAKVLSVTVTSATQATVKYDIDGPGGTALLSDKTGTAVLDGGVWKVGDASFCQLLNLAGGSVPSACKS